MRCLPCAKIPGDKLSSRGVVVLAASLSVPVIGLDHFLRTSPGQFYEQPETEIAHWIADSMMALPLFAIGILAADWVAARADRLGSPRYRPAPRFPACQRQRRHVLGRARRAPGPDLYLPDAPRGVGGPSRRPRADPCHGDRGPCGRDAGGGLAVAPGGGARLRQPRVPDEGRCCLFRRVRTIHSSPPRSPASGSSATAAPYAFAYQAPRPAGRTRRASGRTARRSRGPSMGGRALRARSPAGQPPASQLSGTSFSPSGRIYE